MGGRRDLGVWIDVESIKPDGTKLLTEADVWEAKRELERRGYHVPGIYSGAWYWERMPGGEPSMSGLGYLWVSHYGPSNAHGHYRSIYRGNQDSAWRYPLGDRMPDILQYGSNGQVAGWSVDVNAFRGPREELARIFHPDKEFDPAHSLGLIDRQGWENRVLSYALLHALGLDPDGLIEAALEADNAGQDPLAAVRSHLATH